MILFLVETENAFISFFKNSANIPVIVSVITLLGTATVAFITLYNSNKIRKDTKKVIIRGEIVEQKSRHEKKLNEFYIPLRHYLENSKILFKIFSKDKPTDFRTLTYLLNPSQIYSGMRTVVFNKNDKSILEQIILIGKEIEKLIYEKSYLIGGDTELVKSYTPRAEYSHIPYENEMSLLSLLVSHITVIRMAYNKDLSGDVAKFEGFVFPNEINIRVKEQIEKLEQLIRKYDSDISKL